LLVTNQFNTVNSAHCRDTNSYIKNQLNGAFNWFLI
jgi:hypothetical protein